MNMNWTSCEKSVKNEEKIAAEKNLNLSKDALLTTKSEENFDVDSEKKLHSKMKDESIYTYTAQWWKPSQQASDSDMAMNERALN